MISVVVPVFNEEKNVGLLYTELTAVLKDIKIPYEIICVDDGSTDNTFKTLSDLNKTDSKLKVITFRRNFGQTAALSAGFDYAKGDIVVSIDADLENRPENIKELLRKILNSTT